MHFLRNLIAIISLSLGLALPLFAAEPARPVPPRFTPANMDTKVDPGVDFARYAFGTWLTNNPIPADKSRWGGFDELAQYNWAALKGILETTAARSHEPGSIEQKVGDFFASALDEQTITAAGFDPIASDLAMVDGISTSDGLARTLARLHDLGASGLFGLSVAPDQKNSRFNALYVAQGGLSLPSKEYYFSENFQSQRNAFVEATRCGESRTTA